MPTRIPVVQAPLLDEVLCQLCLGLHDDLVRHKVHGAPVEVLQDHVDPAHLDVEERLGFINCEAKDLGVEWKPMDLVDALEHLAVGLIQG